MNAIQHGQRVIITGPDGSAQQHKQGTVIEPPDPHKRPRNFTASNLAPVTA